jgi:hypothetical protein
MRWRDFAQEALLMSARLVFVPLLALVGCGEITVPIRGQIGTEQAIGLVTARFNGAGTFTITTESRLECEGTYDSWTRALTITAPVVCNDGRTGTAIITRLPDLYSGTVTGTLSDGTEGKLVFGDLAFETAFGEGANNP